MLLGTYPGSLSCRHQQTVSILSSSRCLAPSGAGTSASKCIASSSSMLTWPPSSCMLRTRLKYAQVRCKASNNEGTAGNKPVSPADGASLEQLYDDTHKLDKREGPSTDLSVVIDRFSKLALPYFTESDDRTSARWRLGGVVGLTLACTGVSVLFNFLGRDFFNALSDKDVERFTVQLYKWFAAVVVGVPVFVFRDYYQSKLALEWREWMTKDLTAKYMENRTFYKIQSEFLVDNPDQRISADIRAFTDTAVGLSVVVLNSIIDLVSFSEILYSIYPPLFGALLIYSVGGTAISLKLGQPLIGLNFRQEAREADFRYGLVRIRENSEAIAFYGGERSETGLLSDRLKGVVANYADLLISSRNLSFFTGGYRYLIQILPAAVIAPLYFGGSIQFGVINQSLSAFNHILTDVSLIVYQFESLAGFSAVVDRLGEFCEVVDSSAEAEADKQIKGQDAPADRTVPEGHEALQTSSSEDAGRDLPADGPPPVLLLTPTAQPAIQVRDRPRNGDGVLLDLNKVTLLTPNGATTLVKDLSLQVHAGDSLLLMGPSGTGKTSLLRAIAGLWDRGAGQITRSRSHVAQAAAGEAAGTAQDTAASHTSAEALQQSNGISISSSSIQHSREDVRLAVRDIMFVPQRPYMVLGSLRDQLLYPTWADHGDGRSTSTDRPSDAELESAMHKVRLSEVLQRVRETRTDGRALDVVVDWSSKLSLGEQQRLAFARVLLTKPALVLMDEATSALDTVNEAALYSELRASGVTFISVGHRPTLLDFHDKVLYMQRTVTGESGESTPDGATWEMTTRDKIKDKLSTSLAMLAN